MHLKLTGICVLLAIALVLPRIIHAQDDEYPHPELEWKTIETQHFFVHFHTGAERTAKVVAKVAEEVYGPITSFYDHEPDQKVSFVIRDYDDISNGGAYFYDNKVEIFAPNLDYVLRGTHNWLRDVVSHEFTHIVQIQTTMKYGRKVPGIYLQWLGYESERRPDVLYGYPNVIVSYPLSGFDVPVWFAEGVAQYNRKEFRYDFWDSHRDMILRSYALDGNMLTWNEMGVFGKTSLGNESSYNAGFALVDYIARTYGEDKLKEISRNLSRLTELTIDGAIERSLGKSGSEVYAEWRKSIEADYAARVAPIRTNLKEGVSFLEDSTDKGKKPTDFKQNGTIFSPRYVSVPAGAHLDICSPAASTSGFANMYSQYSPDGKKVAYVSSKSGDYFGLSSLYVYDFETRKETLVQPLVRTAFSWSADGKALYYAKSTRDNPHWSLQFDIYKYTLDTKKEDRLTSGRRAFDPSAAPDGKRIAYVVNHDGTTNLAIADIDGTHEHVITPYENGEQVYGPRWSPSGDRLIFDYSIKDGRDIYSINPDGTNLRPIIDGPDDSRGGEFTPDGTRIIFCSDRTGIFNLYSYDVATGTIAQVSNVLGGAFFPTVNAAGDIIYSSYTSGGYKLVRLTKPGVMADGDYHYIRSSVSAGTAGGSGPVLAMSAKDPASANQYDWQAYRSYDDTKLPAFDIKPYKNQFTSLSIVPFVRVDNYNPHSKGIDVIKPGVYLFSNDVVGKTGFFAGAAINRQLERDLFLQFFYRGKVPILYQIGLEPVTSIELYNVSRSTDAFIDLPDRDPINVDVTYNLFEFDLAFNEAFVSQFSNVEFRYALSRYSSAIGSFFLINGPEVNLVPASSDLYLIANVFSLEFKTNAIVPASTMDISPVGTKMSLKIWRELNQFNGSGDYRVNPATGVLEPQYKTVNFTRAELNWHQYMPFLFENHTLTASLRAGAIFESPVDDFFDFYGGGLVGMKGYPFYAIGGNDLATAGLEYRFPLFNNLDARFMQLYFNRLYASVYADAGKAWTGGKPTLQGLNSDAGVELRLESTSFYALPTRVFFNASYGFNRFDKFIPTRNETVTYGKEWRFYFGVLFGFDLN